MNLKHGPILPCFNEQIFMPIDAMFGNQQQKKKPKFEVRLLNLVISEKGEEAIPNSTTREKTQQERAES